MEYALSLTFICTDGNKATLTVDGVKNDLTDKQVSNVMDTIIAKNIFKSTHGELVKKHSAELTEKQVLKLNVL